MNYDVSRETLSVKDLVFEGCKEIPLDLDFSLPDYCPDIQRVLKCRVCPDITSRNISGDRLNIEGTAKIRVIYSDAENNKIRCCENSIPFSCSIDIKSAPENAIAVTSSKIEYVNCRAVSQRKLDIHGALSICAKVYNKKNLGISCSVSGKDIQQKITNMKVNNLISMGQQQFSISEVLEIPENKTSPESILRSDVFILVKDYKNMANKTVVKGDIIIRMLYLDDLSSGHTETLEYSIPLSQIVDVPGVEESSICTIDAGILSHDEEISSANSGNSNLISSEIKVVLTVSAYSDKEISLVSDVYSTEYDLDTLNEPIKITQLDQILKENFTHKDSINVGDISISKIIDVWSDSSSVSCALSETNIDFKGKINVCVLVTDTEENPVYVERMLEFSHSKGLEDIKKCMLCESMIVPSSISYSVSGSNNVDIKINFDLYGSLYSCQRYDMVTDVMGDESKSIGKDTASLTVYYASEGENIWDIARKYHTSLNMIKNENDLLEDTLKSDCMLLIPMK